MLARVAIALTLIWTAQAQAQEPDQQTLADIRQEIVVLVYEIQQLTRQLSTTQAPQGVDRSGTVFDRVSAIEDQLQRLTAAVEQMDRRIKRVVADGTNRISDLEFRLTELEGGDIGQLEPTPPLGESPEATAGLSGLAAPADGSGTSGELAGSLANVGESPSAIPETPDTGLADVAELAVAEKADFDAATAALEDGNFGRTIELLAGFNDSYPGSPLTPRVNLTRGLAYEGQGNNREAARAYLNSFVADNTGPTAPEALLRLGTTLGLLGQEQEACLTLDEVIGRFPLADEVDLARTEMTRLGCS